MSELGEALLLVALIVVAFAFGAAIKALVTMAGGAEWAGTVAIIAGLGLFAWFVTSERVDRFLEGFDAAVKALSK